MKMEYEGNDEHTHVHGRQQHKRSKSASGTNHTMKAGGASHPREELYKSTGLRLEARKSSLCSPLHKSSRNKSLDVETEQRDSLEKDIEQLQTRLQQEKSVRMLLERALGRTSSTLSPGHRHSANQTKELIAEIELLEEEVVNREQHVLTLYRTIFEQCVSHPSSGQGSVLTSPAHPKKESRKHPTIISSTFCSSKSFPFLNFHTLSTMNTRHASVFRTKANNSYETASSSDNNKRKGNLIANEKPCVQLTLKDHLYECPSKLSEEMVTCMAAAYRWLRGSSSTDTEHKKLSKFSANEVLHKQSNGDDRKSMVEISSISTDKNSFSRASYAINNYRHLVEQLEKLNLCQMDTHAQTAFWINLYNSMMMHAYLAYGIPHSSLRRLALFHKAAYKIGGQVISANAIEQAIFKFRTPRIGKWLETILSTALWKKSGEERQRISTKFGLEHYQPLLCFALCTGTSSDPVLKVYTPSNIKQELEVAKREFLQSNIIVKKSKKVYVPRLLERFGKEANIPPDNLLKWIIENVDKKLCDSIEKCIERKTSKKTSQIIEWLPYNSRFRYVFSKDLSEKPWWL
ncbi:putative ternary complex factor MIP1 [Tanacetum coccineum]